MTSKIVTYHNNERTILKVFNAASKIPFVGSKIGKNLEIDSIVSSAIKGLLKIRVTESLPC